MHFYKPKPGSYGIYCYLIFFHLFDNEHFPLVLNIIYNIIDDYYNLFF